MIFSVLKKLPFYRNYSTRAWEKWWKNRKIDWAKDYSSTWNHPHRQMISFLLTKITWLSLMEVGCGSGANLINIVKRFEKSGVPLQLGGVDVNPEAVEIAQRTFNGGFFRVSPAYDIMMSDNSADVILTDMCLIYIGGNKIDKTLKEIKRIGRNYILLCEFHSESWYDRLKIRLTSGLCAYNYRKLLEKHGFYDINIIKMPPEAWPEADPKKDKFRYILLAKIPRRK